MLNIWLKIKYKDRLKLLESLIKKNVPLTLKEITPNY